MATFLLFVVALASVFIVLVAVPFFCWWVHFQPEKIEQFEPKREVRLIEKVVFYSSILGITLITGLGAYQALYWLPLAFGYDADRDWTSIRLFVGFIYGIFIGFSFITAMVHHAGVLAEHRRRYE